MATSVGQSHARTRRVRARNSSYRDTRSRSLQRMVRRSFGFGKDVEKESGSPHADGCALHAVADTMHADGRTLHAAADTMHADGRTLHTAADTMHADGRTLHAAADTMHADGRTLHPAADTMHADGRTLHAAADTMHADGRTLHAAADTMHADGRTLHAAADTAHADGCTLHGTADTLDARTRSLLGAACVHGRGARTPNDPKLSDCGGEARPVPGVGGLLHRACRAVAVRWSAWLGVAADSLETPKPVETKRVKTCCGGWMDVPIAPIKKRTCCS